MKKVFCVGTFDILHKGHYKFFKDIRKQGDSLLVIVVSDEIVRENKGRNPKNSQEVRAENLRRVGIIDEVFLTKNLDNTLKIVSKQSPKVFAIGYDQNTPAIIEIRERMKNLGMDIEFYISKEFAGGIHTSDLI